MPQLSYLLFTLITVLSYSPVAGACAPLFWRCGDLQAFTAPPRGNHGRLFVDPGVAALDKRYSPDRDGTYLALPFRFANELLCSQFTKPLQRSMCCWCQNDGGRRCYL